MIIKRIHILQSMKAWEAPVVLDDEGKPVIDAKTKKPVLERYNTQKHASQCVNYLPGQIVFYEKAPQWLREQADNEDKKWRKQWDEMDEVAKRQSKRRTYLETEKHD
jgi:hypothetical protein